MKRREYTGRFAARAALALSVALATALLASCGGYYYRATVQGFVVDEESDAGINEATVRVYTDEIEEPDADGYVVQTSTVTQGGSAGYYSSTVIWRRVFGAYGTEGDTTTLWLAITHPDYGSQIVSAEGILSEEDNLIATIRLSQTSFDLPALRGRVVDGNGAGVNGVRVVLDLPQVEGTDEDTDEVTLTATVDGTSGTYEFSPVEWSDANTTDPNGEVSATIRVDDPEWGDPSSTGDPATSDDDYIVERQVVLVPGDQTRVVTSAIPVSRLPRTEFTTTVTGRLVERLVDGSGGFVEDRPVQGVGVTLSFDRDTDGGLESPYRILADSTDAQGAYSFTVTWVDNAPGDFDAADERSGATVGTQTDGIADGEDGLEVTVSYDDVTVPAGTLAFSAASGDFDVVSGPRGGENRLPDVIRTAQ